MTTGSVTDEQVDDVLDYMFCVNSLESEQERGIMINFNLKLEADLPLATEGKLMSNEFPIPLSIMYGQNDWVRGLESEAPIHICNANKFAAKSENEEGLMVSKYHIIPTSDHNLHFDNPIGLANSIINDIYDLKLPIPVNEQFLMSNGQFEYDQMQGNMEAHILRENDYQAFQDKR